MGKATPTAVQVNQLPKVKASGPAAVAWPRGSTRGGGAFSELDPLSGGASASVTERCKGDRATSHVFATEAMN